MTNPICKDCGAELIFAREEAGFQVYHCPNCSDSKKKNKQDLLKDAFSYLDEVKKNLTHKKLVTAKGFTIFFIIASMVVFTILWKNHAAMVACFVSGLLILIGLFAIDSFFFVVRLKNQIIPSLMIKSPVVRLKKARKAKRVGGMSPRKVS